MKPNSDSFLTLPARSTGTDASDLLLQVGTIRDVNLEEFWDNNETLEMLRNIRIGKDSTCAECRFLAFCEGCVANAFLRERTFRCYDPYTCAHYRAYEKVFGPAT